MKRETTKAASKQVPPAIDDDAVRAIEDFNKIQTELSLLDRRLQAIPVDGEPSSERGATRRGLVERRNELLQATPSVPRRDFSALELQSQILQINDRFATPWQEQGVEGFYDRSNQLPDPKYHTSGYIESFSTTPGEVIWAGSFRDIAGTDPSRAKSWHRTWLGQSIFPAAPFKGWLHYRFRLWTEGQIYYAPVDSGVMREYVAAAGAKVGIQGLPIGPLVYETTWALDLALPFEPNLPGDGYVFAIKEPVFGSIPVDEGDSTCLSLILGTIISFANGGTDIAGANMTPSPSTRLARGRVEYRFLPNWWTAGIIEEFNTRM
jgi:hypothetical protein